MQMKVRGSLLERAAEVYDFRRLFTSSATTPPPEIEAVEVRQDPTPVPPPVRMQSVAPSWVLPMSAPFTRAKTVADSALSINRVRIIDFDALAEAALIGPDAVAENDHV